MKTTLLAACCLLLVTPAAEAESPAGMIASLKSQYSEIRTAHVAASLQIEITPKNGPAIRGTGSFEYWASGDSFRVTATSDPRLGLAPDITSAFDGQRHSWYLHSDDLIHTNTEGGPSTVGVPFPNPLFLPLGILVSNPAGPFPAWIDLGMVRQEGFWGLGPLIGGSVAENAGSLERHSGNRVTRARLQKLNGRWQVDGLELEDRPRGTVAFVAFEGAARAKGSSLIAPRHIRMEGLSPEGATRVSILIHTLEINQALNEELFVLSGEGVGTVWDESVKAFVKGGHRSCVHECSEQR